MYRTSKAAGRWPGRRRMLSLLSMTAAVVLCLPLPATAAPPTTAPAEKVPVDEVPPDMVPPGRAPAVRPSTVRPPTVRPPTVRPPTVRPPTVRPPTVRPPTAKGPQARPAATPPAALATKAPSHKRAPERTAVYTKAPSGQQRALAGALRRALVLRHEVRIVSLGKLLRPTASTKRLDAAFELVGKGELELANMEVEKGLKTIEGAVAMLEQDFHLIGADGERREKYVKALTALALAHFLAGNKSKTSEWLSRALVMNPKIDYDKKRFPPKMKEVFDAVHFLSQELGKGSAKIGTMPANAQVWVNGKLLGRAPVTASDLTVGRNLVTASAPGYKAKTQALNVAGKEPITVKVTLDPLPGEPLALLTGAADDIVKGNTTLAAQVAKKVDAELLVLARVKSQGDSFNLTLYAYDAKVGKVVGQTRGTVSMLAAEKDLSRVVETLFVSIRTTREPPKAKPRGPGLFARMYKSKYFWPLVGAIAGAAAIAGATVGIVVATNETDRRRQLLPILPVVSFR